MVVWWAVHETQFFQSYNSSGTILPSVFQFESTDKNYYGKNYG